MNKYMPIIKDAVILFAFSTIFVVVCNYAFGLLKKGGSDPFLAAIIQTNVDGVNEQLKNNPNLEQADENGRTPLMWVGYMNLRSVEDTLKVEPKRVDIAKALIAKGAQVNSRDTDGWTPLMWAAWSGFAQVATVLLDSGADINAVDKEGQTALMIASLRRCDNVVAVLKSRGADQSLVSKSGKNADVYAAEGQKQHPERVMTAERPL